MQEETKKLYDELKNISQLLVVGDVQKQKAKELMEQLKARKEAGTF
jgi:hypothetical protein